MALVTAEELKKSLEAREAGVDDSTTPDIDRALTEAHALLEVGLGYDAESEISATDKRLVLAKRFVRIAAVRWLSGLSAGEIPTPPGAVMTGYTAEGASFQFFTPSGDTTGYDDLDRLLELIKAKKHPKTASVSTRRSFP